jgi:hypothetical protein
VAVSFEEFARELRSFDARKVVLRELRVELRKLLPPIRTEVKARALDTMPKRGGLNEWVAATRLTAIVRTTGRRAGITIKGSRKSTKNKSDMASIDRGRVRAPSWGRRGGSQWHNQTVSAGFFSEPAANDERLRAGADAALDHALDEIRRG